MNPVIAGGLIGVGGTLLGVITQGVIAALREKRSGRRRLHGITAIVAELVATVSLLDKAMERQAWWPEGDERRRVAASS